MIVFHQLHDKNSRAMKGQLPSLPSLRAFESAARHLSFKAAADELCLSQSAISHQIRKLEDFLDAPLFIRHPQRVELTLRGAEYLETISYLLDGLATATQRIRGDVYQGPLKIQCAPAFASHWLLPRLIRFNEIYPDIDVELTTITEPGRENATDDSFDVRINCCWEVTPESGAEPLMRSPHVPVCNPSLLENGPPINCIEDLFQYPIVQEERDWNVWDLWLREAGYEKKPKMRGHRVENLYLSLKAAEEGLGIALTASAFIAEKVALGRLVVLLENEHAWYLFYTMNCAEGWQDQARIVAFREWMHQEMGRCSSLESFPVTSVASTA